MIYIEHFSMIWMLLVLLVLLLVSGVMYVRNQWVYMWQRRFTQAVGAYNRKQIYTNSENYQTTKMSFDTSYCEYYKMFAMFWCWDYRKFVYDERIHEFIDA